MKYYCVVYWYTTRNNKGLLQFKNGSARRRANSALEAADQRVKEQLTAANSADPYEILYVEDVSPECETGDKHESLSRLRQLEQGVLHAKQKQMNMWVPSASKKSEWFFDPEGISVENGVNIGKRIINEWRYGTGKGGITDFPLFAYQESIVDWVEQRYNSKYNALLINAIMRAGKCMITYASVKRLNFKKVLIVTAKPGAIPSWSALTKGGEEEHVDYSNYIFHNYNDYKKNAIKFGTGECDAVACSLQFINKHIDGDNALLKQLLETNWDMIVFDEQHYATNTEKTQQFFDQVRAKLKIELSGTPYKTLLSNRIPEDCIYNFDYIDEQKIRKDLIANNNNDVATKQFRYKADVNWALINVPDKIKAMLNEENFNLGSKGIFATEKGELVYRDAVNEILRLVQQRGYKNLPDKFSQIVEKVTKHTLWVLPKNVAAIKAVGKMLKEDPYFKKFDIIIATGGSDETIATVKNISDVKQRIGAVESGRGDYVGTITLTCGRFLEGTSIPEWWSVHQINDSKSAEDYFQGSFRCKTPWKAGDKQEVIVFEYNPERFVSVMYQHIERKADASGVKAEEVASEFTDCSNVYDYTDNSWNIVDGAELQARFLADIKNYTDRVGNLIKVDLIDDAITKLLAGKKEDANGVNAKSTLNENELQRGSNQKKKPRYGTGKSDEETIKEEHAEAQLRYALKQIYELINIAWAEGNDIKCIEDVTTNSDVKLVYEITGLSPKEWKKVIPAVDVIGMNRAIGQYNAL